MFYRLTILLVCALIADDLQAETKVGFRQVTSTSPVAVQRGTSAEVRLRSNFTLDEAYAVFFNQPGITMKFLESKPIAAPRGGRGSAGTPFRFQVDVPEDQMPGVYEYRVATKQSVSSVAQIMVTDYPVVEEEKRENGTPTTAQHVDVPVAICGECERMEDVDCFQFTGTASQELTFQVYAQRVTDKIHSMVVRGPRIYLMDPILTLIGPNGQIVEQNDNFYGGDSFIACKLPASGEYTIELRDARYAGDSRYVYCLEIADRPHAYAVLPMAVQRGQKADVELIGHALHRNPTRERGTNDGADASLTHRVTISAGKELGWNRRRIFAATGPTNPIEILTCEHPQMLENESNDSIAKANPVTLPLGINGQIGQRDDIDFFAFEAAKGQAYHFEVEARRHGSPLDSVLEMYDADGKLLTEADDLTSLKTKDSRLLWTAPADGKYTIAVRDLHDRGGPRFVYHLRAERATPDFELFGEYYYAMLAPGTRMMWFARVERLNGFDGPVTIEVEGLPQGVTATPVTIPKGMNHCGIILSAAEDAPIDATLARVCGRATIDGSDGNATEIVRYGHITCEQQSSGGGQARWLIDTQLVGVTKPLDLVKVEATPREVTVKPGSPAEIDVRIERADGFKDAVTLDTQFKYFTAVLGDQLPPGVTMSSKSKARLTGDVLAGKIVLEATDKALAVDRLPIAALARVSITFSITTNYASNPVFLTVASSAGAE